MEGAQRVGDQKMRGYFLRCLPRRGSVVALADEIGVPHALAEKARTGFQKASGVAVFALVIPKR